jgi:hypothetical protein
VVSSFQKQTQIYSTNQIQAQLTSSFGTEPRYMLSHKKYACSNLNILTIGLLAEYIHHTILPEMAWKEMAEQSSSNQPMLSQEETEKAIFK